MKWKIEVHLLQPNKPARKLELSFSTLSFTIHSSSPVMIYRSGGEL